MESILALSHTEFLRTNRDYERAATAANLLYVSDRQAGITRMKKGKGFTYLFDNKTIKDKKEIDRIRKLVLPPAWTNVWICTDEKGHIQATGFDLRNRKQYRYHNQWSALRNETKFHRIYEFGKALPRLRTKLEEDLRKKELSQDKVLATIISLMERTFIRVGNNEYEKMYGSYGLTTFKNKHVEISGDKLVFSFKGKKGVYHNITLQNKKLARIVAQCRDIPGKELFQYYTQDGVKKSIDSGMVNDYIKAAVELDFSAKDFRTWAGSLHALQAFRTIGEGLTATDRKKNLVAVLDAVSVKLGNTRTVCKKYYVHPGLIQLYEENKLMTYLDELDNRKKEPVPADEDLNALTAEEQVLMKILKKYIMTPRAAS